MSSSELVILGGSITGLAVLRQAARSGYSAVLVSEPNEVASFSRFGRKLVCHPDRDHDQETLRALQTVGSSTPACLIATSDSWLRFIRRNETRVREVFAQVLHPDAEILDICVDKTRFSAWCAANGVASPLCYAAVSELPLDDNIYPLMLRPTNSSPGHGEVIQKAAEVGCREELDLYLAQTRTAETGFIITQSLLQRDLEQYSVGFVRRNASIASLVLEKKRPTAVACECGTLVELVEQPQVQALGEAVAEKLGYFGIGEVEILRDASSGECFVIEVNARPWLQFGLVAAAGYDWLTYLLQPDAYRAPAPQTASGAWLSVADDLYVCFSRSIGDVRHGRVRLRSYLASFTGVRTFSIWAYDDRQPFLQTLKRQLGWFSR